MMHQNNLVAVGCDIPCYIAFDISPDLPSVSISYDYCREYLGQEAAQIRDEYLELKRREEERMAAEQAAKVAAEMATEMSLDVAEESAGPLNVADVGETQTAPEIAPGQ